MLTKTDLQSYLQCHRKLWLQHHRPALVQSQDTSAYRHRIDGNIVGEMARGLLGEGYIWPPSLETLEDTVANAAQLLRETPGVAATEFPMIHAGLYARADAVVPDGDQYILRETKASTFPLKQDKVSPGKPDHNQIDDLAIQAWVMSGAGMLMGRAELNLLDSRWRYPGHDDYSGLFRQLDVSAEVAIRIENVPGWLNGAALVVGGEMPLVQTGKHCSQPYDCQFQDFCRPLDPAGPEHPIELLPDSAGKKLASKLRETKGYVSILDPKPDELAGKQSELYLRIQKAHRDNRDVRVPGAEAIIAALPYPRYFLDFEGINLPVPRWRGVRPYEQIPFQWSCHIEKSPGAFEHGEFLDLTGNDPSLACIQRMAEIINPDDGGPIFVYFATYEKGRLEELTERHPEHLNLLNKYIARLVDLLPLVKNHYYHPAMRGSFSIKKVLPVVAPDLNYDDLDEVQEGTGAQVAYIEAALNPSTTPDRKADLDGKLRIYCRRDTWAMVEIAQFLAQAERPARPDNM
jgi:Domain of unknown function(DUF2779)